MEGWIRIHRDILGWEWYDDEKMFKLFITLILLANHESTRWHGINIERGQLITSIEKLALQTKCSVQQVRTMINRLKSTSEITSKSTNKFTIITICNYDKYQYGIVEEQQTNQQANQQTNNKQITNKQQTNNKQITTNNNDNNDNNDKNIISPIIPFGEKKDIQVESSDYATTSTAKPLKEKNCAKKEKLDIEPIIAEFPTALKEGIRRWVEYKATEKGDKYKTEMSFRAFCTHLHKLANGDVNTMLAMIEQAIANGWKGVYELKNNINTNNNGQQQQCGNIDTQRIVECGFAMAGK